MKRGFTLLEMLIVIGIIALLIGVMMAAFSGSTDSARAAQCLNNMRSLANAVSAYGTATANYPPAGTYTYREIVSGRFTTTYRQGWIGTGRGNAKVGPYYGSDDDAQHYAITNGAIWRYIKGGRNSYVCPSHVLECKRVTQGKLSPAWSYVMNSYFGWEYENKPARNSEWRIREFDRNLSFAYTGGHPYLYSSRSPSKTLLFAEMPFADHGQLQEPDFATGAKDSLDTVLQFDGAKESNLAPDPSCAGGSAKEAIGFNHRNGKNGDYMAHVAFADGHVEKIPLRGGLSAIQELTTILCVGHGYTLKSDGYEKAE